MFGVSTCNKDLAYLYLFVLVDVDIYQHAVVARNVLTLYDIYFTILEALLFEVLLDIVFSAVDHIGGDLVAGLEADNLFAIFAL